MSVVAVYNMKGGVGKTTTAVNLSYLAAATGHRALLWDLDAQAASSFAFRVRPRVEGFSKKWMESGQALAAAIRETDYSNLDLLPSDFTHRKLDRLLGSFSKPERVITSLLDTFRRDYDVVVLDCPAGFSLLTEGMFAAADVIVVPTIPTVLSLRMVAALIEWAIRADSRSDLTAFLSMVDRRKTLHRRICEWSSGQSEIFLTGQVPYVSVVEQMAVRRMPLAAFAPRDVATGVFAGIWTEIQTRLQARTDESHRSRNGWRFSLRAIESLVVRLESEDADEPGISRQPIAFNMSDTRWAREPPDVERLHSPVATNNPGRGSASQKPEDGAVHFIHTFDTDSRDLQRCGYLLELRERTGRLLLVAAVSGQDESGDATGRAEAQIDSSWATDILSGGMSPLEALERRLGPRSPLILEEVRAAAHGRRLQRINSRAADHTVVPDDPLNSRFDKFLNAAQEQRRRVSLARSH
jgi:chromosome partitioning protein